MATPLTGPVRALLDWMQGALEELYEIRTGYRVSDFVTTEAALLGLAGGSRSWAPEQLLVRAGPEGADVSVFLDEALLETLAQCPPARGLDEGNLAAFCTVLEGVSHFVYLAWNLFHDREVRRLELELQAEVDKYALVTAITLAQRGWPAEGVVTRLFHGFRYAPGLSGNELRRYRAANEYAHRYCDGLQRRFLRRGRSLPLTRELRRFYRLRHERKLRHIRAGAWAG